MKVTAVSWFILAVHIRMCSVIRSPLTVPVTRLLCTWVRWSLKASAAKTTKVSSGKTINPMVVTIAQLNTDLNNATVKLRMYESMLVKVLQLQL